MTLSDAIVTYLDSLRETPKKFMTYRTGLRQFTAFLQAQVGRTPNLEDVEHGSLRDFHFYLVNQKLKPLTQQTYEAAVLAFMKAMQSRDLLDETFSIEKFRLKRNQERRRSGYPIKDIPKDLNRIIAYLDGLPLPEQNGKAKHKEERLTILRARAFTWFLYVTACRVTEARMLDRKHVSDGRNTEIKITGKGDKQEILLFPDGKGAYGKAHQAMQAYLIERNDTFEPLWISHKKRFGHRMSEITAERIITEAGAAVGIHATPHMLRHLRAEDLLEDGTPLEIVQSVLRHSDIGTTRKVYAHSNKKTVKQWLTNSPPALPTAD